MISKSTSRLPAYMLTRSEYFRQSVHKFFHEDCAFPTYHIRGLDKEEFNWQKAWDFCGYHREVGQFHSCIRQIQRSNRLGSSGIHPALWIEYAAPFRKFFRENPQYRFCEVQNDASPFDEEEFELQTFLPYPDFVKSAACLDYKRLGKQRVEAWQIIRIILGHNDKIIASEEPEVKHSVDQEIVRLERGGGYRNHPATRMWEGSLHLLFQYYNAMLKEWEKRGYVNNMEYATELLPWQFRDECFHHGAVHHPPWLGMPEFHASHRAALLYKDLAYYGEYGWKETPKIEYLWPV